MENVDIFKVLLYRELINKPSDKLTDIEIELVYYLQKDIIIQNILTDNKV